MSLSFRFKPVAAVVLVLCLTQTSVGALTVKFSQSIKVAEPGEVFTLDILATSSQPIDVLGWGLDLIIQNSAIISTWPDGGLPAPEIDAAWFPASAADGDSLAGLAFPNPVLIDDLGPGFETLLATLTFSADDTGETDLYLSATEGDLTEGFILDPTGFIGPGDITFIPVHIIVPEPSTLAQFVVLGWFLTRRRNR